MFDLNSVNQYHHELHQEADQRRLARQVVRVHPFRSGLRWLGRQFTAIGTTLHVRSAGTEPNIAATATATVPQIRG